MISNNTFSQSGWDIQTSGVNTFLWGISFVNSNTGYIASDGGKVLKTTNGGTNWSIQNLTPSVNVTSIHFVEAQTGYVAGSQGKIFKTTNGGSNWVLTNSPTTNSIQSLYFSDENNGLIGSGSSSAGELYKTTNGGLNWTQYEQGVFLSYVMALSFPDASTGYAASYNGTVQKTTNAGLNWVSQNTGLSSSSALFGTYFTDVNIGYAAASDGHIIKTINGGTNWSIVYNTTYAVVGVFFPNALTGYAVGGNFTDEVVFRTTNGGTNWISEVLPLPGHANSIFFTSLNEGYITCENGVIYKTTNGGNPIGIEPVSSEVLDEFQLGQNYPNPFNPSTYIEFKIASSGLVNVTIYNTLGQLITVIANNEMQPGTYKINFDASNLPSGIYYYTLTAGNYKFTKKMVLIK